MRILCRAAQLHVFLAAGYAAGLSIALYLVFGG